MYNGSVKHFFQKALRNLFGEGKIYFSPVEGYRSGVLYEMI